jgi:hypothetical protein
VLPSFSKRIGGHDETGDDQFSVFVVAQDVLYYADFRPFRNGCVIIAFDLKAQKLLWKTWLWGIGGFAHSQYWNHIYLEIDRRHLTVYGNEAYGRYIEIVDLSTGKTVGNRSVGGRNVGR